ncbi:glycosyltransferase [uncultured Thiohalocapsa sp.]|uniref:glycosyltransferase family 2 protein n=1 Tax=uncultured Thiohalocapsa sp. TaxID=768990 RepID=UPI0025E04E5A|nr:glycosyltransferase [uncultured Thiohalocapsa sp.]
MHSFCVQQRADFGAAAGFGSPDVTIALTRCCEPDWLVSQALDSLTTQEGVLAEVLLLDQTPTPALADHCAAVQQPRCDVRYQQIPKRSLSYARNRAVASARADSILFLDADAVASPGWAHTLHAALAGDTVGLVGARILPTWHRQPLLLAAAAVVQDQYSIFDLGSTARPFHRVVGAGFGLHRGRLGDEARFDERLGRRPGSLLGGEESDLARRALARGLRILYEGRAVVHHQILPERISYRWILRRMFYAGLSRALLRGAPSPSRALALTDYLALPVVLPFYGAGYLAGRMQGHGHLHQAR